RAIRESNLIKWLYLGINVKRWLILMALGVAAMGLGFSYLLREVYVSYTFPASVYYVTLQFMPRAVRGALFIGASGGLILLAFWRLNNSLLSALTRRTGDESLVNILYSNRYLARGPKVVAIGGGTGLSTLLRGLKEFSGNLTAVVTVADDGGSSGRLRRELGILPPGDVRNCIAALADAEPLMTRLFQYRFSEGSGLEGHSFGNLFIVAMSGVTGNFEEAVRETSRVLAVRGNILPSTLANVTLSAHTEDEETIHGESNITDSPSRIREVYLQPANVEANPDAVRAILNADMIVVGPGSLFTSVMPNLLVDGIRQAIQASPALKVYVCNVATQRGETDSFAVSDHFEVLNRHMGGHLFHYVLANSNTRGRLPEKAQSQAVLVDKTALDGARVITADVVSEDNRYHHDPKKLADTLVHLYYERNQVEQLIDKAAPESVMSAG
ncbi:MAG: gluconeogenesis factor YvcK family protein, partial [Dehalococcoidia bacterium]